MQYFRSPHLHAGLFAALIAVLMLMPGRAVPEVGIQWGDKIAHAAVFFLMTLLLSRSLAATGRFRRPVIAAALVTFGYAFALELAQLATPDRHWELADLVADGFGVLLVMPLRWSTKEG